MPIIKFILFCCTLAVLHAHGASPKKTKVNIAVVIARERGGTGDITSNILAAMQLKRSKPEWNVFLVEPATQRSVRVLRDVLPESEQDYLLEDIKMYTREEFQKIKSKSANDINIAMQFSAPVVINDTKAKDWANQTWIFTEFSIPFWKGPYSDDRLSVANIAKRFNTGPDALGIYIGRKQPKPPASLTEVRRSLDQLEEKSVIPAETAEGSKLIAYSYATHFSNTQKYVNFVYKAAQSKYKGQTIQLIVYDTDDKNVEKLAKNKPKNVELVVLHRRPLSLGIGIMAQANLPMLLTGDLGPALAIEYNKPFFMETHQHKSNFRDELIKNLEAKMTPAAVRKLEKAWDFDTLSATEFGLMTDEELWDQVHSGVKDFRKIASLTENITDYITENENLIKCTNAFSKVLGGQK